VEFVARTKAVRLPTPLAAPKLENLLADGMTLPFRAGTSARPAGSSKRKFTPCSRTYEDAHREGGNAAAPRTSPMVGAQTGASLVKEHRRAELKG
jgi:hypothetical protein